MKRVLLLLPLILAASSSIAQPSGEQTLLAVRAEAVRAEADAARLTKAADGARGEAAKLAAQRLAAAAAIAAAEARISEADAMVQAREALARDSSAKLAAKQAPVAALVAGIVNLGRRPPLVSLAADRDLAQMVRMRALLDVAVPRIRAQSLALSGELAANRRLVEQARIARTALASARTKLARRQQQFAALEARSLDQAATLDASASGADDRMLAATEGVSALGNDRDRARAASRLASELALLSPAPPRPFGPDSPPSAPPFALVVPVDAPVIDGLGQISINGIRSRGTTFAARPGAPVLVPADGILVFAGPYRRHDGIAIIDHGHGWMSLIVGIRASAPKGSRLTHGEPLGKALGPVSIELSTNGRPVSAILIARSS
ncbi:MAG: peptidoglycan DD-metalloendopeptidase family protein [Sphingomicrobium sp.]